MSLDNHKITTYQDNVSDLPDYPSDAGYTAAMLKAIFDGRTDKEIKEKVNALIDELKGMFTELEAADNNTEEKAKKYADNAVATHNKEADAHGDIRNLISELTRRLNAVADSDDTTLDQISELVAYIKENRGLIEAVTTAKANVTDVYNRSAVDMMIKTIEEKLRKLTLSGGGGEDNGNGAILVSIHDDLASVVPEEGQMYVVKYHDLPNGGDEIFYRMKIGDGTHTLAELPAVSNIQPGIGRGSAILYDNGEEAKAPNNIATGEYDISFGEHLKNYAGNAGAAFGYNNTLTEAAAASFIAGSSNIAGEIMTFTAGTNNVNNGRKGVVFGSYNQNTGNDNFMYGARNKLEAGAASTLIGGEYNVGKYTAQFIHGRYNAYAPNGILVLGNGKGEENRSNAFVANKDGSIEINGKNMFFIPRLKVSVPEGNSVICTDGSVRLQGVSEDGFTVFYNIPYGKWTLKTAINGEEYNKTIVIDKQEVPIVYFYEAEIFNNFSDNSINGIIRAYDNNLIPDTWNVGDKTSFTMDGKEFHLVIIGKNVDTFTNGEKAPLTFQIEEVITNTSMLPHNSSYDGITDWENTYLRKEYLPQKTEPTLQSIFQNLIRPVVKETEIKYGTIQITEDTVFVPSWEEIDEGGLYYEHYKDENNRIKLNGEGVASVWWTRTPYPTDDNKYVVMGKSGTYSNGTGTTLYGLSPAFCLGTSYVPDNAIKIGNTVVAEGQIKKLLAMVE